MLPIEYAKKLWKSECDKSPIQSFASEFQNKIESAYQIQLDVAKLRLEKSEKLVGYKIGLTSLEAQKHFGLNHPDFGHLFQKMEVVNGKSVDLENLIQPKIEGEIAFIIGKPLTGPGVTYQLAAAAVEYVVGSLEIIDSRFEKWKIGAFDTIADNGSSARFVLGEKKLKIKDLDLLHTGMSLSKNDEVMITATGAAVMGDPINALAFLANELSKVGKNLEPGHIILTGSLGGMLPLEKNTKYCAEFLNLGKVSVV